MKKIAMLTFYRSNNYGAVLQCYALKYVLLQLNNEVDVINYVSLKNIYSMAYNLKKLLIMNVVKKIIKFPLVLLSNIKSINFKKLYLNFDACSYNEDNIKILNDKYDIFISGSDQVFNPRLTNFNKIFFLDFVKNKNKCFSYAASFGLNYDNLSEEEKKFLSENLQNFKQISVREQEGANIVKKILNNIETYVHLDPTLLLNQKDWEQIAELPKEKDFVLVYLMENSNKLIQYAKQLASEKNLKIIMIATKIQQFILNKNVIIVTPQQWIGYFFKAKYIVTNSFHGLAFSINFNKSFFVDLIYGKNNNRNSRLKNLLDLTNLNDRLIDNIKTNYDATIDWNKINSVIEKERLKSIEYLKEITK